MYTPQLKYLAIPSIGYNSNMSLIVELLIAISLLLITLAFIRYLFSKPTHRLPPGPKGWPILGCLPLLGKMPHVTLANMAKKFGPVMYLKMGTSDMVVVSDPDSAMTVLKTLEHNFSDRPPNAGAVHIAYGAQDFVFADYGPRWKLFRKLINLHMLGSKAFKDWGPIRADEIGHMVHDMYQISRRNEPVEVPSMVWCTMANLISQKSLNRRLFAACGSESNDFKHMIMELMRLAGMFDIGDFIPSLAWMDLQGIVRKMKRFHKKFDALLTKMIDEHSSTAEERKNNPDFMDVVMANKEATGGLKLTITNIKALLMNLFIAGTDTSAGTIEWGLAEMMNNPKILKKAHEEMDRIVGKNRKLEESDVSKLPYLRAICKETFRLHPTTPLSLPRLCTNACELNGYYIPKNTTLLVNIWAIGRNPDVWPDPLVFNPDRFLNEDMENIEPWGNDFELIPFGGGKRMCAGIRLGIAAVEFILGTLVHSFEWNVPKGSTLDLDEKFGLVLEKAVPLSAMVVPRLDPSAYEQP